MLKAVIVSVNCEAWIMKFYVMDPIRSMGVPRIYRHLTLCEADAGEDHVHLIRLTKTPPLSQDIVYVPYWDPGRRSSGLDDRRTGSLLK